jgi:hypothetical protein
MDTPYELRLQETAPFNEIFLKNADHETRARFGVWKEAIVTNSKNGQATAFAPYNVALNNFARFLISREPKINSLQAFKDAFRDNTVTANDIMAYLADERKLSRDVRSSYFSYIRSFCEHVLDVKLVLAADTPAPEDAAANGVPDLPSPSPTWEINFAEYLRDGDSSSDNIRSFVTLIGMLRNPLKLEGSLETHSFSSNEKFQFIKTSIGNANYPTNKILTDMGILSVEDGITAFSQAFVDYFNDVKNRALLYEFVENSGKPQDNRDAEAFKTSHRPSGRGGRSSKQYQRKL